MKKKKVDSVLGYEFKANAESVLFHTNIVTFGKKWKKKKVTVGQIVNLAHQLTKAIQQDLVDIAEGAITIETGERDD